MKCPNLKDKRTKRAMNSIVSALGGTQLTDVEFISKHSQLLRTGIDASSVNQMYKVYDMVPSEHIDGFINNVLLLDSIDDNDIDERGVSKAFILARYIRDVIDNSGDQYLYSDKYVSNMFPRMYSVVNGANYLFGSPRERTGLIDGSTYGSINNTSIGEYLGASTAEEVSLFLGEVMKRPLIDISPSASIATVFDYVNHGIFVTELIPEEQMEEFILEAKKYVNGGTSNIKYARLFNMIGVKKLDYIVLSSNYIAPNRIIYNNGAPVGSFRINDRGEYEMDSSIIIPFVNAISGGEIVINSSRLDIAREINDLGFRCDIIDGRMYVKTTSSLSRMSVKEVSKALNELQSRIKSSAKDFFSNMKSSHRIINPSLTMLLDATTMDLPELISWVSKAIGDSADYINGELDVMLKNLSHDNINSDIFVSMHVVQDELIPFLDSLIDSLSGTTIATEFPDAFEGAKRAVSDIKVRVSNANSLYGKAVDWHLKNRYGFDPMLFNLKHDSGDIDIKTFIYYFKYPEKSKNFYVRKSIAIMKDMMSERYQLDNKYTKIDKLLKKLKANGISDFGFAYEKGRGGIRKRSSATGFTIDNIHWGDFRSDLESFISFLGSNKNLDGSTKNWTADGLYDRSVPSEHWHEYRKYVNDWLKENTVIPMDESYLDAISNLSKFTYIQYTDTRSHLSTLFTRLTASDIADRTPLYHDFVAAYKDYLLLFSEYNSDGSLKIDTSAKEYKMYEELSQFKEDFNPDSSDAKSSKFDELNAILDYRVDNGTLKTTDRSRLRAIFSGRTQSDGKKTKIQSPFSDFLRSVTAGGMDPAPFSNASDDLRNFMFSIADEDVLSAYIPSSEYVELESKYKSMYPSVPGKNGLKTHPWVDKLAEINAIKIVGSSYVVNPLLMIPNSKNSDNKKPSSVFAFDPTTFIGVSSNALFDNESEYSMQPNPNKYFNDEFDKLSDIQREIVDDIKEILKDINKNNGTISMYGPLLPQKATGLLGRMLRHFQSTWNPFSSLYWPIKTKLFFNNETLTSVTGFKKGNNIPSSLFAKNSQILEDPNTISRDIVHLLSMSYSDSINNLVATKRLFALKNLIDSSAVQNPGASKLIRRISSSFLGIEDMTDEKHKKGDFDWGSAIQLLLQPVRGVALAFKWAPIAANIYGSIARTANDATFINRKDLMTSFHKALHGAFVYSVNKMSEFDMEEPEIVKMMRLSGAISDTNERHEVTYGKRLGKFVTKNLLFGPYALSDALSLYPIAETVFKSIKYYDGRFYGKYEFIDTFAERREDGTISNEARKKASRLYNSLDKSNEKFYNGEFISKGEFIEKRLTEFYERENTDDDTSTYDEVRKKAEKDYNKISKSVNIYDAFSFDSDGVAHLKPEYANTNAVDMLEYARTVIRSKHRSIAGNKSESNSPTLDNIVSPQIFLYKGWQINAINNLLVNKGFNGKGNWRYYDPIMKEHIESEYKSAYRIMMKSFTYIPIIGEMIREYNDQSNLTADRRELTQYQIDNGMTLIRSMMTYIVTAVAGTILAAMSVEAVVSMFTGDDDDDTAIVYNKELDIFEKVKKSDELSNKMKAIRALGVILQRSAQEIIGQYNPFETGNILPKQGGPLFSIFERGWKSAMNLIEIDGNSEQYSGLNEKLISETGLSINQTNWLNLAASIVPGVAGMKSIDEAVRGKYGTNINPSFMSESIFVNLLYPRFAKNTTKIVDDAKKAAEAAKNAREIQESLPYVADGVADEDDASKTDLMFR
jgi:hypothetical protein